jgi:uncharacterized protein (UPF0179 family)
MKEWICKEEPLIRADGASVGVGFRQMVELVRCKDCKWYDKQKNWCISLDIAEHGENWFCADGERRTK